MLRDVLTIYTKTSTRADKYIVYTPAYTAYLYYVEVYGTHLAYIII